jgi:hypothetical protein
MDDQKRLKRQERDKRYYEKNKDKLCEKQKLYR